MEYILFTGSSHFECTYKCLKQIILIKHSGVLRFLEDISLHGEGYNSNIQAKLIPDNYYWKYMNIS